MICTNLYPFTSTIIISVHLFLNCATVLSQCVKFDSIFKKFTHLYIFGYMYVFAENFGWYLIKIITIKFSNFMSNLLTRTPKSHFEVVQ